MSSFICDTTLRDGEQTPGVVFSSEEKKELARDLVDFGVSKIELMPYVSREEERLAKELNQEFSAHLTASTLLRKDKIELAQQLAFSHLTLFSPVSDLHLAHKLNLSREDNLDQSLELVDFSRSLGFEVAFACEDASRADRSYLSSFIKALESKVDYVLVCDTVGCLTPEKSSQLIAQLKSDTKACLGLHYHNDFGLATANTLAGLRAGATWFSGTFAGLGERAGNTAIEEVCLALHRLQGKTLPVKFGRIKPIADKVARFSRIPLHPQKPLVGAHAFMHESGIHVDGQLKHPEMYEFTQPESIGHSRSFVFGKHSGRSGLKHVLEPFNPSGHQIDFLLDFIKQESQSRKTFFSGPQVQDLFKEHFR